MNWNNELDKIKKYALLSLKETKELLIVIAVFALIASFNQWGETQFSAVEGITNYVLALFIVGSAVVAHHAAQRILSVYYGFKPHHEIWWPGIIFSVLLVILTQGKIQLFVATGITLSMLYQHRIGKVRYGIGIQQHATIALTGIVANVLLAGTAKTLELWLLISPSMAQNVFAFNMWFAALNMLPIPPLDGSRILYASRLRYVFVIAAIIAYIAFAFFLDFYSYILAIIIGILAWLVYYLFFEK